MEMLIEEKISRRLIVLITDHMLHNRELAYAVHRMAVRDDLTILYLVLVDDEENMLSALRDLATMKAVTAANQLQVEAKITGLSRWFDTLRETASPDDVILCQDEQTVVNGLFKTMAIGEFLTSQLDLPVRSISGYYQPAQAKPNHWFHEVFVLFGFLAIVAVFTWLQIRVEQALDGPLAKIIVFLTFSVEIGAIWFWNKRFDR